MIKRVMLLSFFCCPCLRLLNKQKRVNGTRGASYWAGA